MSKWDHFVYSYIPRKALDSVLEEGLYGGKALLKRPDLLELVAKSRDLSPKKFEKQIKDNMESPWFKETTLGPNVVFKLIPDLKMVPKKHPVVKFDLIPIKINLTKLLNDYPETKIFGMELEPFSDKAKEKDRYHYLDSSELDKFFAMSAKDLWSTYNDIDDKGLYAADVPHASIHTISGIILPKYIEKITKKAGSEMDYSDQIKLINEAKQRVKSSDTIKDVFDKYEISLDEIDLVPVCFAELDVSARTDHGVIYLGNHLLEDPESIDHYLAHELTHYAQQTTGDGPTKGSNDENYLSNPYEVEGFQNQTEYLSETRDDETAEDYIEMVMDHHGEKGKERKNKRKQLLRLNALKVLSKFTI